MTKVTKRLLKKVTLRGKTAKRVGSEGPISFEFQAGVNLLAGPNGSGKSTLLTCLGKANRDEVEAETNGAVNIKAFDFEKGNPRIQSAFGVLDQSGQDKTFNFEVASRFLSHGETIKHMLPMITDAAVRGSLVLLDEPDQTLDLRGIQMLEQALLDSPAPQALVSCHSPYLLLSGKFNVVELRPGYLEELRAHLQGLLAR